jgi:DNA-binding winged helix-turn-helix (wHTH) protein
VSLEGNLTSGPFQVADRTVFPTRNRVRGPAGEVHIEPKAMDVLCTLAGRSGEVMSREALIDAVWAVRFGGDESLTRVVSMLRKTLGAGAIETVSKRGYRLAAEVKPAVESPGEAKPAASAAVSAPAPAPQIALPRPARAGRAYRLSRQGLGPRTMFPVSGLDFWRLPAVAVALAVALALGVGAADLLLHH